MKWFYPTTKIVGYCSWILFASLVFLGIPARADTFTVTNLNDAGPGSLRQAVVLANDNFRANTIVFQAGLTGTITLASGAIDITSKLTINGPGVTALKIDGNKASRIFNNTGTGATIQDLAIINGNGCGGDVGNGGAIHNSSFLTLTRVVMKGNTANNNACLYSTYGGAIYNSGNLTINYSSLLGNSASGNGGAIWNDGTIKLNNSTVAGNNTEGSGGGIYNNGTLTVVNSTFSGNTARDVGGGIVNGNGRTLTITNSTISGNSAVTNGGGIHNGFDASNPINSGTVNLGNSIVIGNIATTAQEVMSGGTCNAVSDPPDTTCFTSKGSNLFGENGDAGVTGFTLAATDKVLAGTIDTAIDVLDSYGGPTMTFALVADSPAINAGDNALIPTGVTTDQRGTGFPRIINTTVDIGAVEYGSTPVTYALTVTKAGTGTGTVTSNPTGINCGATCSATFTSGTNVVLTAAGVAGTSAFANWGGACTGTTTTCTVAMTAAKAVTATFNLISKPDFAIPVITIAPAIPGTNGAFTATVTVKNQSTIAADGGQLRLWANQPAAQICATTGGDKNVAVGTLAAGASKPFTVTLSAGAGGMKVLRAFVDATCAKAESNEANNQRTLSYRVARLPDLIITNIALTPATPAINGTFNAAITVKNQGATVSSISYLDVWTNQTTAQTCGAMGNTWVDVGPIPVGASKIITVNGLSAGAAGSKTLQAFVDSWCETVESNETNNQLTKVYTVQ